jgi:hypothetical protein
VDDVMPKPNIRNQIAALRSSANRSMAELEKAFIRHGSGRYFLLLPDPAEEVKETPKKKTPARLVSKQQAKRV